MHIGCDYSDHADLMGYSHLGFDEHAREGNNVTVSDVLAKERELIAEHDSKNPDKGYNLN